MIGIIDGWSFTIDEHQYILIHQYMREKQDFKTRKGTGEMVEKREEVGYFSTLEGMLCRLAQILAKEKVDAGSIATIKGYIIELREITKMLHDACKM